jgi:hypothetical protein
VIGAEVGIDGAAVPHARADTETVVVDGDAVVRHEGAIHLLNPTAALVWQCCDGEVSVGGLAAELADAFGTDPAAMTADVTSIVAQLVDHDLVVLDGEPPPAAARVIEVAPPCASCGDGPDYDEHVLVEVGGAVVSIGADREVADALARGFGARILDRVAPSAEPPVYGVVLPAGERARGVQELARLYRGPAVLVRSREPGRVVRALLTMVAAHGSEAPGALDAVAVGREDRVVLTTVPRNPAAFARAAAARGLAVSETPLVFVAPDGPALLVGAPGLAVDPEPLRRVAAARRHLGTDPAGLPEGRYELAGIAVPGPATAARVLAELAPVARGAVEPTAALDALLTFAVTAPLASGNDPATIAALLDRP